MTFKQKLAAYVIGYLTDKDIPDIGISALSEGLESENLTIMAGLSENENRFVLRGYFTKALEDMQLQLPDTSEAKMTIVDYYADEIIAGRLDPYDGYETLQRAIGFDDDKDRYDLGEAYRDYIVLWETHTNGLCFYDKSKTTKEQFIVDTNEALVNALKRRKARVSGLKR
ncbi:MAG: hypothetical protein H6585_00405 [Flavobacteriales bacterium]|nr:hypothetical protein [Flavobacteriales bacterium]MCB9446786.1 hypothetical protein [Flavobacteriales bacterium]